MSAIDNKRSVVVGIFIFLGIIIFVAAIFLLAGQQKRFIRTVSITAVFDDVAGLRAGNNIWLSGVKVGTIRAIQLYGNSQVQVTMNIEEAAQQYVRKDAIARISSESLIGNMTIVIDGGTNQSPPVENGDVIRAQNPLNTDDLMETLQKNNKNLVDITNDFRELSSKIVRGEGTVGAILTDSLLANNFRSMVDNLQRASGNTVQASNALSQFTSKLNTKGGLANEMLTDTAVFNQLRSSVAQLQETANAASLATNNIEAATSNLNSKDNTLGLLLNDVNFAATIRKTMYNLESSSQKLDQNMEALRSNFLFRGYFRKQDQDIRRVQEQQPVPVVQPLPQVQEQE